MISASATGEMSLRNLNEDVTGALNFIASNKLVANPNIGLYSSQDLTTINRITLIASSTQVI